MPELGVTPFKPGQRDGHGGTKIRSEQFFFASAPSYHICAQLFEQKNSVEKTTKINLNRAQKTEITFALLEALFSVLSPKNSDYEKENPEN